VNKISFGEKVRELRDAKNLSLRELAAKIDVSAGFLSDVELGKRFPKDTTLVLLAGQLDTTADELKKYDFRDEADAIKKMMFADPAAGMAFRSIAQSIKSGTTSPEEILRILKIK
jgi:transcriptional regulator with XRE-family HTH domain